MCLFCIDFFVRGQQRNNMSKSTPINQLQQPLPNIDLSSIEDKDNTIIDDDDATIQEVLSSIGQSNNNKLQQDQLPVFDSNDKNALLIEQQQQLIKANEILKQMNDQKMGVDKNVNSTLDNIIMNSNQTQNTIRRSIAKFTLDIKNAILIFCVVIIIHFIPLHKYISKYFSIDKIPYNIIILRGIMAVFFTVSINKWINAS